MIATLVAAASLLVWIILFFARGRFWTGRFGPTESEFPGPYPSVSVIIPARDEAEFIAPVVESLLRQRYPGRLQVILVDDHSSDGTQQQAMAAAARAGSDRLSVRSAAPLPAGWKGKMWALDEGLRASQPFRADYYLFADADIVHSPDSLNRLVMRAQSGGFDLVSYMVKLRCETLAERALMPAFSFFFFMLYPPRWVSDGNHRTAAAAGGCALIRSATLSKIGGIAAIQGELIDDCALAGAVKHSGGTIWLGQTETTRSIRPYGGFSDIAHLISRTAFTQLRHSSLLLAGTVAAMSLTYLVPPVILAAGGWAALFGASAWIIMSACYWPTLHFYKLSPLWAPALPLVALFYLGATVQSAVEYWNGSGGQWKGRVQDPMRA
jgi:hopene-associated glycosyltransferase HpnB